MQVYQHLRELAAIAPWITTCPLAFDDACHLYKFIQKRQGESDAAKQLWEWAEEYLRCDRMHFQNHKKTKNGEPTWCAKNMDPDECTAFNGVETGALGVRAEREERFRHALSLSHSHSVSSRALTSISRYRSVASLLTSISRVAPHIDRSCRSSHQSVAHSVSHSLSQPLPQSATPSVTCTVAH